MVAPGARQTGCALGPRYDRQTSQGRGLKTTGEAPHRKRPRVRADMWIAVAAPVQPP
jgi:hypothetical protein